MAVGAKIVLTEGTQPITPAAGKVTIYPDTDGKRYSLDSAGKRRQIDLDPNAATTEGRMTYFNSIGGYSAPGTISSNVAQIGANRPMERALWLPEGARIDRATLRVNVVGTSNPGGFIGIYAEDGQTLLLAIDSIDWTAAGQKTYSFTQVDLPPGLVHVVLHSVDAATSFWGVLAPGANLIFRGSEAGAPGTLTAAPATWTIPKNTGNSRMAAITFYKNEP